MEDNTVNNGQDSHVKESANNKAPENNTEKVFKQNEVDEIIKNRLSRESEKYSVLEKDYSEIKSGFEAAQKQLESLKAEKDSLSAEREELSLSLLRNTIALENGLPKEAMDLLHGKNEEELKSNAEKIKKLISSGQKPQEADFKPKDFKQNTADVDALFAEITR